jgi:hypothetical protein
MGNTFESLKKNFTSINEPARRYLKISRDEYGLCAYVQYRSADPRQKIRGWCCDSKAEVADWVGITRAGIYKMIDRLSAQNLIEADAKGNLSVTAHWVDIDNECKLSLQKDSDDKKQSVNLVDSSCKLSLQINPESVNLVTHNIELDKREIKEGIKNENEFSDFSPASTQSGNSTVEEEKEKTPLTPSSAAPRSPKKEKSFEDKDVAKHLSGKEQVFFAEILKNETWPKWLDYKKKKFKFEYDAADSAARIIRKLYTFSGGNAEIAAEIAAESRANGWKGFFPLEKPNAPAPFPKPYAQPMSEMAGLVIRK